MRIKEKTSNKNNAQCAKMTDERSINGDTYSGLTNSKTNVQEIDAITSTRLRFNKGPVVVSSNHSFKDEKDDVLNPESPNPCGEDFTASASCGGGRLKFFKDGKFILELSHRKDGEKTIWIPVPKKTFWPVIGTPRQESSTSLSVSDDNSSVQSSPWQRDHFWKQTTPKCNIGKEMEFQLIHPRGCLKYLSTSQAIRSKRRRPFDPCKIIESPTEWVPCKPKKRKSLLKAVQSLWERVVTTSKPDPGIVSPRKRILRELERVTLEEATKRQRARAPTRNVSSHSISSILGKEDESVLRTLLKSPSPPRVPTTSFLPPTSHVVHPTLYPATSTSYYPSVPPYRAPHAWPIHYPVSSPPLPLPSLYHVAPFNSSWPHLYRSTTPEASPDVPLNLSKNAG